MGLQHGKQFLVCGIVDEGAHPVGAGDGEALLSIAGLPVYIGGTVSEPIARSLEEILTG